MGRNSSRSVVAREFHRHGVEITNAIAAPLVWLRRGLGHDAAGVDGRRSFGDARAARATAQPVCCIPLPPSARLPFPRSRPFARSRMSPPSAVAAVVRNRTARPLARAVAAGRCRRPRLQSRQAARTRFNAIRMAVLLAGSRFRLGMLFDPPPRRSTSRRPSPSIGCRRLSRRARSSRCPCRPRSIRVRPPTWSSHSNG